MAGGTDLLGQMMDEILPEYPEVIINLKNIPGMDYIKEEGNLLKIGAFTRLEDIAHDKSVKDNYTALAEAAHGAASPHIREMGSIAGNICQSNRCWYYWFPDNTFHCIRKGGKICNALTGENRYHSIFGAARVATTPCSAKCPGTVNIPLYLSKIREGKLREAANILLDSNPIPALTGRVCPHTCEGDCNRGEFDEAVSIRTVERFMGDYILENSSKLIKPPATDSGKSVAIVGSGPAGLSAAFYLRRSGHRVTVFDKMAEPGGMLAYAIPPYRLPKDVVRKQIKALQNTGIEFKTKVNIGTDITLDSLKQKFNSLFLASGTWEQPSLRIEDEKLLESGLDFLTNVNLGSRKAPGRKVLVIGGGNVAVDVAITALRLGATEVTMACLECRTEMPAFPEEMEQAVAEGVQLLPSWGPSRILKANGKVSGMELVQCTSVFDREGRFSPAFDNKVKKTIAADQIMLAIGQRTDLAFLDPSVKVERGLIIVDKDTQATSIPGVFAGGDVTSGPASVIEAIAAGRRAAEAIDHYLKENGKQSTVRGMETPEALEKFNSDYLRITSRLKAPERPVAERTMDREDVLGLDQNQIETEANRCFNCGCVAVNTSDIAPVLVALNAKIKTTRRTIQAEDFCGAGLMKTTTLDPDELVTEIQIPKPKPGSKQSFLKFRLRNSIDFPILSVSTVFSIDSDKFHDARIILGAVAPVPLRAKEAEDFLKGKVSSEEVAEQASVIAVKGTTTLAKNKHKVEIAKALVRRAILAARNGNPR